jgi:16S rRNA A1518/A1519 N6-dimethyltransferase RsmA/KsgA/DIM1 with predicted DNA glycosylase/AP lyase activity
MLQSMFAKCCKTLRTMLQSMFAKCCKTFRTMLQNMFAKCCKTLRTMLKNMFAKCCKTFKFRAMLQSMFTECCKTFRQSNEQCCKALPSPGYLPLCLILEYYISLLISNSVQPWNNTNIYLMT